jgi:TetR/AcrR family transcriptional repressor of nem operon
VTLAFWTDQSYIAAMTTGRPMQFDPDEAVERAMHVFWSQGFEFTSLQELLAAMKLSKSSLYQTFGSKEQLFERCVGHYLDQLAGELLEQLDAAVSGRKFLEDLFYALPPKVDSADARKGCLLWNTANEFGERDAAVKGTVSAGIDRLQRIFVKAVERAQREGDIASSKDPRALATYLMASMSGLKTLLKSGVDRRRLREVVATVLQALD